MIGVSGHGCPVTEAPFVPVLIRDRVRVPPLGGSFLAGFSPRGLRANRGLTPPVDKMDVGYIIEKVAMAFCVRHAGSAAKEKSGSRNSLARRRDKIGKSEVAAGCV